MANSASFGLGSPRLGFGCPKSRVWGCTLILWASGGGTILLTFWGAADGVQFVRGEGLRLDFVGTIFLEQGKREGRGETKHSPWAAEVWGFRSAALSIERSAPLHRGEKKPKN